MDIKALKDKILNLAKGAHTKLGPTDLDAALADEVSGNRYRIFKDKANGALTIDANGGVSGKRSKSGADELSGLVDDLEELQRDIDDAKDNGEKIGSGTERAFKKSSDKINAKAKSVFRDLAEAQEHHAVAIKAARDQRTKLIQDMTKHKQDALDKVERKLNALTGSANTAAAKDALRDEKQAIKDNFGDVKAKIDAHFDEIVDAHKLQVEKIETLATDIEQHTELKFESFKNKKVISEITKSGEKTLEKEAGKGLGYVEKVTANFSKGGGMGKAKVLLGGAGAVGFGISGAKDVLTSLGFLSPGVNADGIPESTDGGILKGGAKLLVAAGGAVLAQHGHGR